MDRQMLLQLDTSWVLTAVLCLGQDSWGTPVSLYPNFRGTFAKSGGHTKSIRFYLLN